MKTSVPEAFEQTKALSLGVDEWTQIAQYLSEADRNKLMQVCTTTWQAVRELRLTQGSLLVWPIIFANNVSLIPQSDKPSSLIKILSESPWFDWQRRVMLKLIEQNKQPQLTYWKALTKKKATEFLSTEFPLIEHQEHLAEYAVSSKEIVKFFKTFQQRFVIRQRWRFFLAAADKVSVTHAKEIALLLHSSPEVLAKPELHLTAEELEQINTAETSKQLIEILIKQQKFITLIIHPEIFTRFQHIFSQNAGMNFLDNAPTNINELSKILQNSNRDEEKALYALLAWLLTGQDVNEVNAARDTLLVQAVANDFPEVVAALMLNDANPEILSAAGDTPLIISVKVGNPAITELLSSKADANRKNSDDFTAAMLAALYQVMNVFPVLLNHNADVNAVTAEGFTALMWATIYDQNQAVQFLLNHNADSQVKAPNGINLLMLAALSSSKGVLSFLLQNALFDPNARNTQGYTAVTMAICYDEIVDACYDDKNILNYHRSDIVPLHLLTMLPTNIFSTPSMIEALSLLHGKTDVNIPDKNGRTALMLFILNYERQDCFLPKITDQLLAMGAEVNAQDNNGHTALMHAAAKGDERWVGYLLRHGANISLQDHKGFTAWQMAQANDHPDLVPMLRSSFANLRAYLFSGINHYLCCYDQTDPAGIAEIQQENRHADAPPPFSNTPLSEIS